MIHAFCNQHPSCNDLWHITGLAPGAHTIRVVVRDDKDDRPTGDEIQIMRGIVYGSR
jgi:hypothetical protein